MALQKKPGQQGPDGVVRSAEVEERLNKLFAATFAGESGKEVLRHLRTITIEAVAGPGIGPNELMHREGMRFLAGIIEQRIARGRNG
jgi:hypothetical protein